MAELVDTEDSKSSSGDIMRCSSLSPGKFNSIKNNISSSYREPEKMAISATVKHIVSINLLTQLVFYVFIVPQM